MVAAAARPTLGLLALAVAAAAPAAGPVFQLPTANRALFEKGGEERFFVGTVGKPWTSGTFGCVRSEGWQMHEGLDIRCLKRNRRGEPLDPVLATADGTMAYFNTRGGLSTFGKYLVLRHVVEGLEVYSLYAHLSEIRSDLRVGQAVRGGEAVATMGRTAGTREGISKDRAHVHFELNLLVNERFPEWFKAHRPGERNDHGAWNGQNMVGLDPREILLLQASQGSRFSLTHYVQSQTELCRVLVRATSFPWLRRYAALVVANPRLGSQAPAGYELVLNYNGLPFQVIPRPAADFKGPAKFQLLSVNAPERQQHPCRRLVVEQGKSWALTSHGQNWLDLLTY